MKKINHFTFDDIMKRRTLDSLNKQSDRLSKTLVRPPTQQEEESQLNENQLLMNIFEEFNTKNKNYTPAFNTQTKTHLAQMIANKLNLRLNCSKIAQNIKIKKVQFIQVLQKPQSPGFIKKQQPLNLISESRKLESSHNTDSKLLKNTKSHSYFVLSGNLYTYQKEAKQDFSRKRQNENQTSDEIFFYNWKQFELQYPLYKKTATFTQFTGFGPVFSPKILSYQQNSNQEKQATLTRQNAPNFKIDQLTIAQEALLVEIQNPQYEEEYLNQARMDYEKIAQTIQNFPIFKPLGKRIRNFVQFFELKQYQKHQKIYTIGDKVDKFYLILKGQVVFQHYNTSPIKSSSKSPKQSRRNSIHNQAAIKTQTISSGNYFGQECMIFHTEQRLFTAKCKSQKCQLLQIPRQKFEKMLQYSDFHDFVKNAAELKFKERFFKLKKNQQIINKFAIIELNQDSHDNSTDKNSTQLHTVPLFGTPKQSNDGRYKVMHGQVIRQFSKDQKQKMNEDVQFSMLKVNPDMYDKTVDKFRKYNIKPRQKYVPQVNWELKRVWKVLNLENVLREQAEVTSPEGRKYYDSHKRYICQIKQSKSLRPKTSSSTYRTKLQYIAYLQKFKSQK